MILCINDKNFDNEYLKFELEIFSNHKIDNIQSNSTYNMKRKTFEIYGKWDLYNSGGGPNQITFLKNPQYILNVGKTTDSYIELYSHNSYLISLQIYDVCENRIIHDIRYDEEMTFLKIKLENNKKYILMPFTKNKNLVLFY
jgi:hypothetical protein